MTACPPSHGPLSFENAQICESQQKSVDAIVDTAALGEMASCPATLDSCNEPTISPERTWPRGWRPNLCLLGCFFLMFNSWGLINSYGSFASYYNDHLLAGKGPLLINLIGSTQSFFLLLLSGVTGRLLDAGYIRTITGVGTVLISLGLFSLSVVNSNDAVEAGQGSYSLIWLTQGFIIGLGMACFFVTSSQVVATWYARKRSLAIGIVATGASMGGLIYPILVRYLIGLVGFNNGVRYIALVAVVTSIFAFFVVQPSPTRIFRKPPQGWMKIQVWIDVHAIRNLAFTWYMVSICLMFFGFHAVYFSLEEWAAAEGFGFKKASHLSSLPNELPKDSIRTFWLLSIMNATSTFGRLGTAYLSDHFGALNIHLIIIAIAALLLLVMWPLTHTLHAGIAFAVLFGIASGAVIALPPAAIAHILGPAPEGQAKLGQWNGMTFTASAIFALTGPMIAGQLVNKFSSFLTVQLWSGICFALSALCMVISRMHLKRYRKMEVEERKLSHSTSEERGDSITMTNFTSKDEPQALGTQHPALCAGNNIDSR